MHGFKEKMCWCKSDQGITASEQVLAKYSLWANPAHCLILYGLQAKNGCYLFKQFDKEKKKKKIS